MYISWILKGPFDLSSLLVNVEIKSSVSEADLVDIWGHEAWCPNDQRHRAQELEHVTCKGVTLDETDIMYVEYFPMLVD